MIQNSVRQINDEGSRKAGSQEHSQQRGAYSVQKSKLNAANKLPIFDCRMPPIKSGVENRKSQIANRKSRVPPSTGSGAKKVKW